MDRHFATVEMPDRVCDRAFPFKAQVAVAGLDRQPRHLGRCEARAVKVELGVAETVAPSRWPPHQLGPQHVAQHAQQVGAPARGGDEIRVTADGGATVQPLLAANGILVILYVVVAWSAVALALLRVSLTSRHSPTL